MKWVFGFFVNSFGSIGFGRITTLTVNVASVTFGCLVADGIFFPFIIPEKRLTLKGSKGQIEHLMEIGFYPLPTGVMLMKKLAPPVQVIEVPGEGLIGLLGKTVMIETPNFNYTGILSGVNKDDILLDEPSTVFDTGAYTAKTWADSQRLPTKQLGIRLSNVISYYEVVR